MLALVIGHLSDTNSVNNWLDEKPWFILMKRYVTTQLSRLKKKSILVRLIESKNKASESKKTTKASEKGLLEQLEKFTFCDVCILLIEREIEIYQVNEHVS